MAARFITRRRFLTATALGASALVTNGCWIEPNRIRLTEHVLGDPGSDGAPPLRLAQLSDLHLQQVGRHEERIAEAVHEIGPDVVILSGDVIDRADRFDVLDAFLTLLPATIAGYAILGNWEHWAGLDIGRLARLYDGHGVTLLINQTARLRYGDRSVLFTGLDDATGGAPSIRQALDQVEPSPNHVLLAHSPAYRDVLQQDAAARSLPGSAATPAVDLDRFAPEYMLSGHTHGGQINLLGWAPLRPRGSGRYVRGWYRDARPHLYVSQGLGTSVVPVRFGAVPEIACFTWYLSG